MASPVSTVTGVFCMVGGHAVRYKAGEMSSTALEEGWRLVRASVDKVTGKWYPDPDSQAQVLVCPKHQTGAFA